MNIIDEYKALVEQEKWAEAVPVIEAITARGPNISTSWFNYGVCLSALGRHGEAADRFLRAYELNPEDYGAQYWVFRSLFDAGEHDRFLAFARRECEQVPGLIDDLTQDEHFRTLFARPEFEKLRKEFPAE